jgi:hypothetical protein
VKLLPFTWLDLKQLNSKPVIVMLISMVCLIGMNFFTNMSTIPFLKNLFKGEQYLFYHYLYWAVATIFFYLALPIFAIKFLFKERLRDYGLKRQQFFGYYKVYLLGFLLIFPVVILVSYSPDFQSSYPFYVPVDSKLLPRYFIWEIFYVLQFFALEFFFRGFMVHGLKTELGLYSIAVMTVPYCMIHFAKPLPECVGSIFAGIFLGMMSYKTQSIWLGSLLHAAVGVSMNWLSLWQRGFFNSTQ